MEITEEQRKNTIECSTERHASKDFPEYAQFFTGEVEFRKACIVNSINEQKIDVIEEAMIGGLGDVLDVYFKLKIEEQSDKSLFRKFFPRLKRFYWDRNYLLSRLKTALNQVPLKW